MPTGYPRHDLYSGEKAKRIIELYASGLTCAQVGAVFECSGPTIERVLEHLGIPRHGMTGHKHTEAAKKAVGDANTSRVPGDWWITTDGYISVYQPEHPYANSNGDVREHRLVVEVILGRFLLPEEVVHHINGIKHDNEPSNLELFASSKEHSSHHAPTGRMLSDETKQRLSQAQYAHWARVKAGEIIR